MLKLLIWKKKKEKATQNDKFQGEMRRLKLKQLLIDMKSCIHWQ